MPAAEFQSGFEAWQSVGFIRGVVRSSWLNLRPTRTHRRFLLQTDLDSAAGIIWGLGERGHAEL